MGAMTSDDLWNKDLSIRKLTLALGTWYHHPDGTTDSCSLSGARIMLNRFLRLLVVTFFFFWTKIYINGKYICSHKSLCSVITVLMLS